MSAASVSWSLMMWAYTRSVIEGSAWPNLAVTTWIGTPARSSRATGRAAATTCGNQEGKDGGGSHPQHTLLREPCKLPLTATADAHRGPALPQAGRSISSSSSIQNRGWITARTAREFR